ATVVTLISAMLHGTTPACLTRLSIVPGIDRRTLARWRAWWLATFTDGPFALVAKATFMPPVDIAEQLTALLRFVAPLTGGASAMRAFRRASSIRRGCPSPAIGGGAYRRSAHFVGGRTWRSEAGRGYMSGGRGCASR